MQGEIYLEKRLNYFYDQLFCCLLLLHKRITPEALTYFWSKTVVAQGYPASRLAYQLSAGHYYQFLVVLIDMSTQSAIL